MSVDKEATSPHTIDKGLFGPNAVYPTWIVFGVLCTLIGLGSFITNALMLEAQKVLPCNGFKILGGLMVPISFFMLLGGVAALRFRSVQDEVEEESTKSRVRRYVLMGLGVIFFAIVVFLSVVAGSIYSMSRSVPTTVHDYRKVGGIEKDVGIRRDGHGIPHVKGESFHDALFGQGFVHAQDRLFQIEFMRLVGQGRLAEHVGKAALEVDKIIRTMRIPQSAKDICNNLSEEDRANIEAYVAGFNSFLNEESVRPPEFRFMHKGGTYFITHEPEDLKVDDVCRIGKLLQWRISTNFGSEQLRWNLFSDVGLSYDETMDLFVHHDNATLQGKTILDWQDLGLSEADAVTARAREAADLLIERTLYESEMWRFRENETRATSANLGSRRRQPGQSRRQIRAEDDPLHLIDSVMGVDDLKGSNAWVTRKGGKQPIGASDPHLEINTPSVWHHAHVAYKKNGTTHNFGGVVMPGLPGVLIGKNDHVSWGITMALTDLQDVYVMQPHPNLPDSHYVYHGEALPYETVTETIKISGGGEESHDIRLTVLGPVISKDLEMSDNGHVLVLNSSCFLKDDVSFKAFFMFADVQNVTDFHHALSFIAAPALSITFADSQGNIGYAITGKYPQRAPGHTGRIPILGNGSFDIQGYIPYDELPSKIDTNTAADGYTFAANQKIYPDGYKYTLGYDWHIPFRGAYIKQKLEAATSDELSSRTFSEALQLDSFSPFFDQEFAPHLNGTLRDELRGHLQNAASNDWLARLDKWDRVCSYGSEECSFFWQWMYEIAKLPEEAIKYKDYHVWKPQNYAHKVAWSPSTHMLKQCSKALTGSTANAANDTCLKYVAKAFDAVADRPAKSWGTEVNTLVARHPLLGETFLGCIFNRRGSKDGDPTSPNVAAVGMDHANSDLDSTNAASMRQIYDWNEPKKIWLALPAGNNGNPWSSNYNDLFELYSDRKYWEVSWDVEDLGYVQLLRTD